MAPLLLTDLDRMAEIIRTVGFDTAGPWGEFHGRTLDLPPWFDITLDPRSPAYRDQQFHLWRTICGMDGEYVAARDEQAPEIADLDAIRFPAFFARRDPAAVASAGDHLVAMGHLLQRCGLVAGDWALEYGAGFGQTALALARLGVNVDTIDINPMFCRAVDAQARHFDVPLNAFPGAFGDNPRGDARYAVILFYESFHHCADFVALLPRLRSMLRPGGRILMAGEPIVPPMPAVPYPWGVRLDAVTVAVMRWRHWLELGYQESFLVRAFIEAGFTWRKFPCALTHYGETHEFRPRAQRVPMSEYGLPADAEAGWYPPEPDGRWTGGRATLPVDARTPDIALSIGNYHPNPIELTTKRAGIESHTVLAPMQCTSIPVCGEGPVTLNSQTLKPSSYGHPDDRQLGVFVHCLEYPE